MKTLNLKAQKASEQRKKRKTDQNRKLVSYWGLQYQQHRKQFGIPDYIYLMCGQKNTQ